MYKYLICYFLASQAWHKIQLESSALLKVPQLLNEVENGSAESAYFINQQSATSEKFCNKAKEWMQKSSG
jgi:ubiquitin-protein ligase